MATIKTIGVLTGGGDCPGLNAVIRAVTKSAIFDYGLNVIGIQDGFLGLIENHMEPLASNDVSNILTQGGTILGSCNKANPAAFVVYENGQRKVIDVTDRVLRHIKERQIDALVCIGGDGTMSGAAGLIAHGVTCVGVPKTIDNDLEGCDQTFGFDTAVQIATEALDRVHTTAASHHRVMVVELMGRNAGWITLAAGLASGSDVVLIPEIHYSLDAIIKVCQGRLKHGKRFTIIAVSEGAKPQEGEQVVARMDQDSPDPVKLGGIAHVLAQQIEKTSGLETRSVVLGHVQRGGTPSAADRILGTIYGSHALDSLMNGSVNTVSVLQGGKLTSIPIQRVANKQRLVPRDGQLIRAARAVGTSFGEAE